jgi:ubiquinone/menaquinone biosynthesis C-methylase UbiE
MVMDRPQPRAAGAAWAAGDVARGWQRGAAARGQALGPVTELMLDRAGVSGGCQVLDLGAGTGDQTLLAAQRVGPGGRVLAIDISAAMLALARTAARAAGLHTIQTQVMDAQSLALAAGTVDAVIARFSLQFVPDVQQALAEVRRVLKPGGTLAAVVFSAVEQNLYRAAPPAIASRLAGRPFPAPGPGQWALNDPATLRTAYEQAGFRAVAVEPVPIVYRFPSLADALRNLEEAQPLFMQLLAELSAADRASAWAEVERTLQPCVGPDGFAGPCEALLAAGTA